MISLPVEHSLRVALAYFQAGQLSAAEGIYRQILAWQPETAEAWYRLGLIRLTAGRCDEAATLIARAIGQAPAEATYHSDLGTAYHLLGRLEDAVACFQQAIAIRPDLSDAHLNLGETLLRLLRFEEAIEHCRQGLALRPDYAVAHNNLGNALARAGRKEEAAACYRRAAGLNPAYPEPHQNLGTIFLTRREWTEAADAFARAIALRPNYTEAHSGLGGALLELGRIDEAIAACRSALAIQPASAEAHNHLGHALMHADRWEEAVESLRRARALKPDCAEAHSNLGAAYAGLGRAEEAVELHRQAIAVNPLFDGAYWNLSLALLLLGRYEEGWREYERRFSSGAVPARILSRPRWNGERIDGRTLLIHCEQGFGDTLQFVRYLPLVRERSGADRVILECQPSVTSLLAGGQWDAEVIPSRGDNEALLPPYDCQAPLLSLPLLLRILEPLTITGPYLSAEPDRCSLWRKRLGPSAGVRVGLAWAGNPAHGNHRRRSIDPEMLRSLLRTPGASFYSLQVDSSGAGTLADAGLVDLTAQVADFSDTAALVTVLDLIITVDTAVAHLAGAMGRPVWLLLPFVPDWRWGLGREETPWYPTMRLFRQTKGGDWESLLKRVSAELSSWRLDHS